MPPEAPLPSPSLFACRFAGAPACTDSGVADDADLRRPGMPPPVQALARRVVSADEARAFRHDMLRCADEIREQGRWCGLGGELAVAAITGLKGWPAGRQLHIQRPDGRLIARFGDPAWTGEPVCLRFDGSHYDALVQHRLVEATPDGDCFFASTLAGLDDRERRTLLDGHRAPAVPWKAEELALRRLVSDVVRDMAASPETVSDQVFHMWLGHRKAPAAQHGQRRAHGTPPGPHDWRLSHPRWASVRPGEPVDGNALCRFLARTGDPRRLGRRPAPGLMAHLLHCIETAPRFDIVVDRNRWKDILAARRALGSRDLFDVDAPHVHRGARRALGTLTLQLHALPAPVAEPSGPQARFSLPGPGALGHALRRLPAWEDALRHGCEARADWLADRKPALGGAPRQVLAALFAHFGARARHRVERHRTIPAGPAPDLMPALKRTIVDMDAVQGEALHALLREPDSSSSLLRDWIRAQMRVCSGQGLSPAVDRAAGEICAEVAPALEALMQLLRHLRPTPLPRGSHPARQAPTPPIGLPALDPGKVKQALKASAALLGRQEPPMTKRCRDVVNALFAHVGLRAQAHATPPHSSRKAPAPPDLRPYIADNVERMGLDEADDLLELLEGPALWQALATSADEQMGADPRLAPLARDGDATGEMRAEISAAIQRTRALIKTLKAPPGAGTTSWPA